MPPLPKPRGMPLTHNILNLNNASRRRLRTVYRNTHYPFIPKTNPVNRVKALTNYRISRRKKNNLGINTLLPENIYPSQHLHQNINEPTHQGPNQGPNQEPNQGYTQPGWWNNISTPNAKSTQGYTQPGWWNNIPTPNAKSNKGHTQTGLNNTRRITNLGSNYHTGTNGRRRVMLG